MHQEFDQWSDKQYEKKLQKEKARWEKEKKQFYDRLEDTPAMLEKARKLAEKEEAQKQQDAANQVVLKDDDEDEALKSFMHLYDEAKRLSASRQAAAA